MAGLNSGNLAALNDYIQSDNLENFGTIGIVVTGTWSGTIQFYVSIDGVNFVPIAAQSVPTGRYSASTAANGQFLINMSGIRSCKTVMGLYTSGTATVSMLANSAGSFGYPVVGLRGADGTEIGNIGDRLKVDAVVAADSSSATAVLKQTEMTVTTKNETIMTATIYTVPVGKQFKMTNLNATYNSQTPLYIRFKKQTGGSGSFVQLFKMTVKQNGQDECNVQMIFPLGLNIGAPGDVFEMTFEASVSKGDVWAGFSGVEF